jgi:hypothetical protein
MTTVLRVGQSGIQADVICSASRNRGAAAQRAFSRQRHAIAAEFAPHVLQKSDCRAAAKLLYCGNKLRNSR